MDGIKVRAKLIELWTRVIGYDKNTKVYTNGSDNLYPNEMERAVGNSPTASRSAKMMAKFIAGEGITGKDILVNAQKNKRLTDIIKEISGSISVQNGFFLHINYRATERGWEPSKLTVMDYIQCRISKEDDNENQNKIWVGDWEKLEATKTRLSRIRQNQEEKTWYYPFNSDSKVVAEQIEADTPGADATIEEKVKNYRGQILYVNLTPHHKYSLSKFDGVYNDCDTEYRMSLYANTVTRGGFLGKTCVLTQGLDEEKAKEVVQDIQAWLGSENSGNVYHLDVERTEDLDNVLKVLQLESQYNDDMFTNTDKRIRRNITGAANNIPEPLIYAGDGALFGTSGDAYREMKEFYNEQTQEERQVIERTMRQLGFDVEILPFDTTPAKEETDPNKEKTEEEEVPTTEEEQQLPTIKETT